MWVWGHGLDWSGSQQGQVVGFCENGNESSSSTKCRKLPGWLSLSKKTLLCGFSCLVTYLVAAQNMRKITRRCTVQRYGQFVQITQINFTKWIICSKCLGGRGVNWCIYLFIFCNFSNWFWAGTAQSVWRLATGWKIRESNPGGGEIFRTRTDRPWGPLSLLHNGYQVFPGVKRPGRGVDHPPRLALKLKKE